MIECINQLVPDDNAGKITNGNTVVGDTTFQKFFSSPLAHPGQRSIRVAVMKCTGRDDIREPAENIFLGLLIEKPQQPIMIDTESDNLCDRDICRTQCHSDLHKPSRLNSNPPYCLGTK